MSYFNKQALMMAALGAFVMMDGTNKDADRFSLTEEEFAEIRRRREIARDNNLKKKGVKEFQIDGIIVYARDYKNAIRKVNNIKKKLENDR